jgi:hypothetical protein
MAARGTRRPHPRRVRSKPVRKVSGNSGSGWGCAVIVAAFVGTPLAAALWMVTR